jgi:hypothetical protein
MIECANPRCRLAPPTPSQQCVPSIQNRFNTTFTGISERLHRAWIMQQLTACHHHRRPSQIQKPFSTSRNRIQYP